MSFCVDLRDLKDIANDPSLLQDVYVTDVLHKESPEYAAIVNGEGHSMSELCQNKLDIGYMQTIINNPNPNMYIIMAYVNQTTRRRSRCDKPEFRLPVAFAVLTGTYDDKEEKMCLFVDIICSGVPGLGLAGQLFPVIESFAVRNRFPRVTLNSVQEAVSSYVRYGYRQTGALINNGKFKPLVPMMKTLFIPGRGP